MKKGKSPGEDGARTEMWKVERRPCQTLLNLLQEERIPSN